LRIILTFISIYILVSCSDSNRELPKILIVGDSISGGYFPYVKKNLTGKAKLFQAISYDKNGKIKPCCGGTTQGVQDIDIYLSEKKMGYYSF
jgi:hypothetical protein